ncbi:MAG: hypothetical protein R3Y10_04440 [Ferrimonas sp.]
MRQHVRRYLPHFNHRLSKRVLIRVTVITVLSMLAASVLFYLFYERLLGNLADLLMLQLLPDELALVSEHLPSLHSAMMGWLIGLVLIQATITLLGSLWLVSKLTGPIFSIQRTLEQISLGDLSAEVHLSKQDDMAELASAINDCTARIQIMVLGLKENLVQLQEHQITEHEPAIQARLNAIQLNLDWFETVAVAHEVRQEYEQQ